MYHYLSGEEQRMKDEGQIIIPCPKAVRVAVPFSFRQPFKRVQDIKMHNDFGSILVELKLFNELPEALTYYMKLFEKLKTSFAPFGVLLATKLTVALPFAIPKLILDDMTRKYTMVYTNLVASKKPYYFDGKKMLGQFFFAPGVNRLGTCVSILTCGDIMSVACFSDYTQMKDP